MKKNKQSRQLQASNAAHKALQNRAIKYGEEHKRLYHGACILRQEKKRARIYSRRAQKSL